MKTRRLSLYSSPKIMRTNSTVYSRSFKVYSVAKDDFYQQIKNASETRISLQYNLDKFLTFKVYEARLCSIVGQGFENITLQCKIRGVAYTFTYEHLVQMSHSEINELFNHLGLDSRLYS